MEAQMKAWAIKDWSARFTCSQAERVTDPRWVPVPIRTGNERFRRLMATSKSRDAFGLFIGLVEVAAKMPVRGVLADKWGPLAPDSLALHTGAPESAIMAAIDTLSRKPFGWLYEVDLKTIQDGVWDDLESTNGQTGIDTQIQKRREENQSQKTPLPPELDSPEFRERWAEWFQHRQEIRKPVKPTAAARMLAKLKPWGVARAVAAIDHSVAQGWTGIFEPDGPASGAAAGLDLVAASRALVDEKQKARIA